MRPAAKYLDEIAQEDGAVKAALAKLPEDRRALRSDYLQPIGRTEIAEALNRKPRRVVSGRRDRPIEFKRLDEDFFTEDEQANRPRIALLLQC
jgi:hypothetical protein